MSKDKYSATWVSHTSIKTFLECPRAYFLANVYRDPISNHKIRIITPPLALGLAVHDVLDEISNLPAEERFNESLVLRLDKVWEKVSGKLGGFVDIDVEHKHKLRAQEMLRTVMKKPGPLKNPAVKIKQKLPYYWLSEEDNIILCGKIDWLEWLPKTKGIHIIDFKTGKTRDTKDSHQLPIYHLLAKNCQKWNVDKASYWYLEGSTSLYEQELPDLEESHDKILDIARTIKVHRQLKKFKCPTNGCRNCIPFERIVSGEGEIVAVDEYNYDIYVLPQSDYNEKLKESVIL